MAIHEILRAGTRMWRVALGPACWLQPEDLTLVALASGGSVSAFIGVAASPAAVVVENDWTLKPV